MTGIEFPFDWKRESKKNKFKRERMNHCILFMRSDHDVRLTYYSIGFFSLLLLLSFHHIHRKSHESKTSGWDDKQKDQEKDR